MNGDAGEGMDPRVEAVYKGVGQIMKRYTTGKVPKAFKIIPKLRNWEEVGVPRSLPPSRRFMHLPCAPQARSKAALQKPPACVKKLQPKASLAARRGAGQDQAKSECCSQVRLRKMFHLLQVLYLTEPENWSPHAVFQATRMFVSNLSARLAQRFLALVLLPHIREDIRTNKRLHFALFQAVKKATFKPDAFYKVRVRPSELRLMSSKACCVFSPS